AGRPLVDYFAPESRAEILERVRRRKAGLPTDMNYEAVGLRVNGQSFPMHLTIAPISLPDGEAHIGFVMDITERKRAEEQLRRSEEKFRLMVEGMPLGLALVSRTDGRIIHINAKFTELFGYTIEDIRLETDWWARAYPEPAYREQLLAEMQKRTEWVKHDPTRQAVYDTRVTCKDGTEKIVEWGFIIMGDRRVIYGVDITGRRQAEALRDRLEAQNRQLHKAEGLGRMAGAIAHHFNNQLMTVMLNLDLARQDLATAQVAFDSVGNLEDAMQAARRLADMSQAMLTYLGYNQVQNEVLDFAEACQVPALLTFFRESLPKGVQLEMDCPSPGPKVFGNRNQFQQVTANLLANAAEAMGENAGKIHLNIRTCSKHVILAGRCFPVDFQPDAEVYACLEVIDVGVGIAAKDIENLFDPFYSSKLTGRGMGLAVVLGIARTHRGAITVASQVGRGSVFRVFVPIHEAERVLAG
ncbi:MAG TPA: PAS domain S-box protein, partial [Verrucomicrobiae bacterium]